MATGDDISIVRHADVAVPGRPGTNRGPTTSRQLFTVNSCLLVMYPVRWSVGNHAILLYPTRHGSAMCSIVLWLQMVSAKLADCAALPANPDPADESYCMALGWQAKRACLADGIAQSACSITWQ
jgi:hypothetical protein